MGLSTVRHTLAAAIDVGLEVSVIGSFSRIGPAVRSRLFGWSDPVARRPGGAHRRRDRADLGPRARADMGARGPRGARGPGRAQRVATRAPARRARRGHMAVDRFPVVVADLGVARVGRGGGRPDPGDRDPARRPRRQRRAPSMRHDPRARTGSRRRWRCWSSARSRWRPASTPAATDARVARDRRHLGRDVRATAAARRPPVRGRRLRRDACVRAGKAGPGGADARVVAAQRAEPSPIAAMHPGWADTPGLAEALPGFHRVMRPLLRSTAEGIDTIVWLATHPDPGVDRRAAVPGPPPAPVRSDPLDEALGGRTPPPVGPHRGAHRAARPGARRLTLTVPVGTRDASTRRSAPPTDRLGHGRGGIDDAIGHPHGSAPGPDSLPGRRRPADGDQRHVVLEQRVDDVGRRLAVARR